MDTQMGNVWHLPFEATCIEVSKLELFMRQLVSTWDNAPVGRILVLDKEFELSVLKQIPDTVARSA